MQFFCRIVLETDPSAVIQRVALRNDEISFSEQSVAQVGMQVSRKTNFPFSLWTG